MAVVWFELTEEGSGWGLRSGSAIPSLVPHAARGPKITGEAPHVTQPLGKGQRGWGLRGWGSWTKAARKTRKECLDHRAPERISCVGRQAPVKPRSPARSLGLRQIMP